MAQRRNIEETDPDCPDTVVPEIIRTVRSAEEQVRGAGSCGRGNSALRWLAIIIAVARLRVRASLGAAL